MSDTCGDIQSSSNEISCEASSYNKTTTKGQSHVQLLRHLRQYTVTACLSTRFILSLCQTSNATRACTEVLLFSLYVTRHVITDKPTLRQGHTAQAWRVPSFHHGRVLSAVLIATLLLFPPIPFAVSLSLSLFEWKYLSWCSASKYLATCMPLPVLCLTHIFPLPPTERLAEPRL